jgi:NADH-quinone oxidoreductase subunit A
MTELAAYILLFVFVAVFFVFIHLVMGRFLRPVKPDAEKATIYECGEPTVGSAWIQFDLRFYVVALLFVIFDVEAVFFFPWAVVFGKANTLSNETIPDVERVAVSSELIPTAELHTQTESTIGSEPARELAWIAFWDILVFFGVLLVGFAYLWKRGDLDWVRSTMAETTAEAEPSLTLPTDGAQQLAGAARS